MRVTLFRHVGRGQRATGASTARFDVRAPSRPTANAVSPAWPSPGRVVRGSMPQTLARAFSSSMCWVVRSVTRARVDGRGGDGIVRRRALLAQCREHGGFPARGSADGGVPVKVEAAPRRRESRERVGVRAGEFVDNDSLGRQAQCRSPTLVTGPVGWADRGARGGGCHGHVIVC